MSRKLPAAFEPELCTLLMHIPSPQHMATEEPQRAHVRDDRLDGQAAFWKE